MRNKTSKEEVIIAQPGNSRGQTNSSNVSGITMSEVIGLVGGTRKEDQMKKREENDEDHARVGEREK